MVEKPRILVFAGSTRKDSYNKKLAKLAAVAAEQAGAEVMFVDLRDFPMPLYDGDFEAEGGIPENAKRLKELFKRHQGLIIASPEYNSSITAVLKNTIDWTSRPEEGEKPLAAFAGKTTAIISASPGALGGLRGLVHLRAVLGNIQVLVLPDQLVIPNAHKAFADDGSLQDKKLQQKLESVVQRLSSLVSRLGE